jgi:plasmid stabilization system protein ParE
MVQKITWSAAAQVTLDEALGYLSETFSDKEVQKFADRVQQKLLLLQYYPRLGTKRTRRPNVYKTVIHKRIILLYQHKPLKKEILLLVFWNTHQSPDRLKL